MPDTETPTPNPGSHDARENGCICAVLDNNHGKFKPWTGGWWITQDCPLHDTPDYFKELTA